LNERQEFFIFIKNLHIDIMLSLQWPTKEVLAFGGRYGIFAALKFILPLKI
jgi:hypothetical protein